MRQFVSGKPHTVRTDYWHRVDHDRVQCDICPRACRLHEGQRGACFVRGCEAGEVVLYSYGKSSGFVIDPIEKKPLNHFYPGSPVLSFGTAGCNLACKFCQNWDMTKSREMDILSASASPQALAETALKAGCRSVAFTYNDPVIFHEYAIDTAQACASLGVKSVAVTAGYMSAPSREEFFNNMDAANVDLKAFNADFYKKICGARLDDVLETLCYIHKETSVWLEITTLLIPEENDSLAEIHAMCEWLMENIGPNVPLHFTAFHPDWKMRNKPRTPAATLKQAREIALRTGLQFVYTGNLHDTEGGSTYCPACQERLIARDWYNLLDWHISVNNLSHTGYCGFCGSDIPGVFDPTPGTWGRQRQPVDLINPAIK